MMQENWAIILAAGSSTRMGTQKLLLPFNGSTMIETVIRNVLISNVDEVVIVLGKEHERIASMIGKEPVKICVNPDPGRGMLSSVNCGIDQLPEKAGAALIFLGDQPGIPPSVPNAILDAHRTASKGIIIPLFSHHRGHPLLVDMKYRSEIRSLDPKKGLRSLMKLYPGDVLELDVNDPGILVDIDTRKDYSKATQKR